MLTQVQNPFSPARANDHVPIAPIRARGRLLDELAEFVSQPALAHYEPAHAWWVAHVTYARRAAVALAMGDLHRAQRDAEMAVYALSEHHRYGGAEPEV